MSHWLKLKPPRFQCNFYRRYDTVQNYGLWPKQDMFSSEFKDHVEALHRKWINRQVPNCLNDPLDHWISCTILQSRNEGPTHSELASLNASLDKVDFTTHQLMDALELLTLWPCAVFPGPKRIITVPTIEEKCVLNIRETLKRATSGLCFYDKLNYPPRTAPPSSVKCNKVDMLRIGNLWSFIDRPGDSDSMNYRIAWKLCHKDGGRMLRAFRNATPDIYLDLLGLLNRLQKTPPDLHNYYLAYKFYDLYKEFNIHQKTLACIRLSALNITLYKNNRLFVDLASWIVDDLHLILQTQKREGVMSVLKFIRPLIKQFPKKFVELNSISNVKNEESLFYLCSDAMEFANESLLNRACSAFLREESKINNPSHLDAIVNFAGNDTISAPIREEINQRTLQLMKGLLVSGEWHGCKKVEFIDVMLKLAVHQCLDDELINMFVNSNFFFQSRGLPHKKYAYGNLRQIGIKIAMIESCLQIFNNYNGDECGMSRFRVRLCNQTLTQRDGDNESLMFMKYRDHFIQVKNRLVEELGSQSFYRECMILPHHEPTQLIIATKKSTNTVVKIPSAFDSFSDGDIKKPIAEEDLTWHAISFSSKNHNEYIGGRFLDNELNPYFKCLNHLGYKVTPINLKEILDLDSSLVIKHVNVIMEALKGSR